MRVLNYSFDISGYICLLGKVEFVSVKLIRRYVIFKVEMSNDVKGVEFVCKVKWNTCIYGCAYVCCCCARALRTDEHTVY